MHDPAIPVTFVPAEVEATERFYKITNWPTISARLISAIA